MHVLVNKVVRAATLTLDLCDPHRLIAITGRSAPDTVLLCVYRYANAANVCRLADQVGAAGGTSLLWALDRRHPSLSADTVGEGPGSRFALLNRLARAVPPDQWLLVADDDVRFGRGGVRTFLHLCQRLGFDLAQPAHALRGSHLYFWITRRHFGRVARETTFVEIGPVVAVSPQGRTAVTPFPEEGMGWGTELLWNDLQRAGLRLGVVDATPMRHLSPVGAGYDRSAEESRVQTMLTERGLERLDDIQQNVKSFHR